MYTLQLSQTEMDELLSLLDKELRSGGLSSLQVVVSLYNTLSSAKPLNLKETLENEVP